MTIPSKKSKRRRQVRRFHALNAGSDAAKALKAGNFVGGFLIIS